MPELAEILVFTFKAGLLARAAHDLRLHVEAPEVTIAGDRVVFSAEVTHLRVDGAMRAGRLDPVALSSQDRAEIEGNLASILHAADHPRVGFRGEIRGVDADTWKIEGELQLCGRARPVAFEVRRRGERLLGSLELTPSRWGIQPFRALAGAIRLQDRVRVDLSVDARRATARA